MHGLTAVATLQSDEDDRSHDGDEVERQVHDISDDRTGAELLEGTPDDLAKLCDGITARLQFSTLGYEVVGVLGDEGSVEGVEQGFLEQPILGDCVYDGGTLVEDKEDRRQDSNRPVHEDQHSELRQVGEGEHANQDTRAQHQGRDQLAEEGFP